MDDFWNIMYSSQAKKDLEKFKSTSSKSIKKKFRELIDSLSENPYQTGKTEKLKGFNNIYKIRLNRKHRIVYEIRDNEKIVNVVKILGHYDTIRNLK